MRAAVRALIRTRKPVGLLGWGGRHAQMLTGYYGLRGDPFARNPDGTLSNAFTVAGFYLSDPLRSDGFVNDRISYVRLRDTSNLHLRFRRYRQSDSWLDDRYTAGITVARNAWIGRFVLVVPRR
jgi:hypothetical protein